MAHSMIRRWLLVVLALALPVTLAAAAEGDGPVAAAWMEALLADAQAQVPATTAVTAVAAAAAPCSPDCDALNGTSCSPVGARTTCYVPVPGGCQAYTCRCSGSGWACP